MLKNIGLIFWVLIGQIKPYNDRIVTLDDIVTSIVEKQNENIKNEEKNIKIDLYDFLTISYKIKTNKTDRFIFKKLKDVINDINLFSHNQVYVKKLKSESQVHLSNILQLIPVSQKIPSARFFDKIHIRQRNNANFFISNIPEDELCLGFLHKYFATLIQPLIVDSYICILVAIKYDSKDMRDNSRGYCLPESLDKDKIIDNLTSLYFGLYDNRFLTYEELLYYKSSFYPILYQFIFDQKIYKRKSIHKFLTPFEINNYIYSGSSNFYNLIILKDWSVRNQYFLFLNQNFDPNELVSYYSVNNYLCNKTYDSINFYTYKQKLEGNFWKVNLIFDNFYSVKQTHFEFFYILEEIDKIFVVCTRETKWQKQVEKSQNEIKEIVNLLLQTLSVNIETYPNHLPLQQFMLHKNIDAPFDNHIKYQWKVIKNVMYDNYIEYINKVVNRFVDKYTRTVVVLYDCKMDFYNKDTKKTFESCKIFQYVQEIQKTSFLEYKKEYNGFMLQLSTENNVHFFFFEYYDGYERLFYSMFTKKYCNRENLQVITTEIVDLTHYKSLEDNLLLFLVNCIKNIPMYTIVAILNDSTRITDFTAAIQENIHDITEEDQAIILQKIKNDAHKSYIKFVKTYAKNQNMFDKFVLYVFYLHFSCVLDYVKNHASLHERNNRNVYYQPAFYYHNRNFDVDMLLDNK
ncbi:hypothetical protein BDAP_002120 [Binucleata daphniae]